MFILQQELAQIVRFTSLGKAFNINKNAQVLMSHATWHFFAGLKYPIITHYHYNKLYMRFLIKRPPIFKGKYDPPVPYICPLLVVIPLIPRVRPTIYAHILVVIVFSAVLASFFDRLEFATSDRRRQRRRISTVDGRVKSSRPVGWVKPPFWSPKKPPCCVKTHEFHLYMFFCSERNGKQPTFFWGVEQIICFGFPFRNTKNKTV